MTKKSIMWAVVLTLLAPLALEAQQDPQKIGEGAQVYATTCARCHNARSGTERTDLEWVAIVAHMRARANMTKSQADVVLAFLQATNMPEGGAGADSEEDAPTVAQAFVLPPNSVLPASLWAVLVNMRLKELAQKSEAPTGGNRR